MSFEILSREVLNSAEEEIANLQTEADLTLEIEREESLKRIEEFKGKTYDAYERELRNIKENLLGKYQRDAKNIVLRAKKELIDEIREELKNRIFLMSDSKRANLLKRLFLHASTIMKVETIICRKEDEKLVKAFSGKLPLRFQEMAGGLILEGNNGSEIVDLSLENFLSFFLEQSESKIQRTLFEN